MRAVIDIGSNSVLLLIAERDADGQLHIQSDESTITRVSQGVAASGELDPEAIARTLAVLERYRDKAAAKGAQLVAVATEGLRMAKHPEAFLEPAAELLGVPVRMISGDEEARLSYRSIALEQPGEGRLRVVDIGGASTELICGHGERVDQAVSHAIGSVRFSERYGDGHPPSAAAVEAMHAGAREALASQPLEPHDELHGLAGTVTTVAALVLGLQAYDRERVDGTRISRDRVAALRDELASWPLARLEATPVIGAGRADVIVAGTTILLAVLEHCGADTLVVRDRGLRYALL